MASLISLFPLSGIPERAARSQAKIGPSSHGNGKFNAWKSATPIPAMTYVMMSRIICVSPWGYVLYSRPYGCFQRRDGGRIFLGELGQEPNRSCDVGGR